MKVVGINKIADINFLRKSLEVYLYGDKQDRQIITEFARLDWFTLFEVERVIVILQKTVNVLKKETSDLMTDLTIREIKTINLFNADISDTQKIVQSVEVKNDTETVLSFKAEIEKYEKVLTIVNEIKFKLKEQ